MERPILFSGEMVRAILGGRKTQTRRVMKYQPIGGTPRRMIMADDVPEIWQDCDDVRMLCPYGIPGDRLWSRETHILDPPIDGSWPSVGDTYGAVSDIPDHYRSPKHVIYRATCDWTKEEIAKWRWRPSIFLPRWASRITLEITDVRVERLQDISEEDARAEGLSPITKDSDRTIKYGIPDRDGLPGTDDDGWPWSEWCVDPRDAYRKLWGSIHGPDAWAANPWVWVLSFTVLGRG